MNKQRKVLITITYNEMGIIIDTKAEEIAQPNLQPTCNQLATDCISRQAAIDVIEDVETKRLKGEIGMIYAPAIKGLRALPPAQADSTDNAEFWRKRAKDYENMVINLTAKISKDARLESMEMNAEGLVFKMKEPPAQADQKWTPCIKEQPKKPGEYFITWTRPNSNGLFVGIAECEILNSYDFERNEFEVNWILDDLITDNYKDVKVIAWQQLIEPYRGDWES